MKLKNDSSYHSIQSQKPYRIMPRALLRNLIMIPLIALVFCSLPARSEPGAICKKYKGAQLKACYLKEYRAADNSLNKTYQKLKERIKPDAFTVMQSQSRNWIKYKEYQCGWQSQLETGKDNDTAVYYNCLNLITRDRTAYLKKAFSRKHQPPGLHGFYDDAFGGSLTIGAAAKKEHTRPAVRKDPERGPSKIPEWKEGSRYKFNIEVVRGPTHHIGEISGEFQVKDGQGIFLEKPHCAQPEINKDCCKLTFTQQPYSIKVEEQNCGYHHGARAYFDGEFLRVE